MATSTWTTGRAVPAHSRHFSSSLGFVSVEVCFHSLSKDGSWTNVMNMSASLLLLLQAALKQRGEVFGLAPVIDTSGWCCTRVFDVFSFTYSCGTMLTHRPHLIHFVCLSYFRRYLTSLEPRFHRAVWFTSGCYTLRHLFCLFPSS